MPAEVTRPGLFGIDPFPVDVYVTRPATNPCPCRGDTNKRMPQWAVVSKLRWLPDFGEKPQTDIILHARM